MHRLPPDGRAPAGFELELPAVEGTHGFPFVDPAASQRSPSVRATADQHVELAAVVENSNGQPVHLDGMTPHLNHLVEPANGDHGTHRFTCPGYLRIGKTKKLGLASWRPVSVESTEPNGFCPRSAGD